jgi:hypothetical protein
LALLRVSFKPDMYYSRHQTIDEGLSSQVFNDLESHLDFHFLPAISIRTLNNYTLFYVLQRTPHPVPKTYIHLKSTIMSSIINKAKEVLHKDKSHEAPEGTHGPHNSRMANAADPRIDSDRDRRAAPTTTTGTHGLHEDAYSRPAEGVHAGNYNTAEGVHGPHNSRIANTVDPRVDSDRDNRAAPHSTLGSTGATAGTEFGRTAGTGSAYGTSGTTTHTTTGHTSSNTSEGTFGE